MTMESRHQAGIEALADGLAELTALQPAPAPAPKRGGLFRRTPRAPAPGPYIATLRSLNAELSGLAPKVAEARAGAKVYPCRNNVLNLEALEGQFIDKACEFLSVVTEHFSSKTRKVDK